VLLAGGKVMGGRRCMYVSEWSGLRPDRRIKIVDRTVRLSYHIISNAAACQTITTVPPPVRKLDPKNPWAHQAGTQCCSVPPSIRKINSKGNAVLNARRAGQWRQIQEKAQDYSGFGLKLQTPIPKSAQLASRAPVRAAGCPTPGRRQCPRRPSWPDMTAQSIGRSRLCSVTLKP
jgi:hypothetical protein